MNTSFPLHSRLTLQGWQSHLQDLYGKVNSERRPLETLARVTEMATGISRGVRENNHEVERKFFPRFLSWLMGLCNQLDVGLEQAVYDSYPGVCAYCRSPADCTCKLSKVPQQRLRDAAEIKALQAKNSMPNHLREWVALFGRIYGTINKEATPMKMLSHFMEELGEVCEIVRFHLVTDAQLAEWKVGITRAEINTHLREELADLFAWFCGLSFELGIDVDSEMKDIYQAACPECLGSPCVCSPYRVHRKLRLGAKRK